MRCGESAGEKVEEEELTSVADRNAKWCHYSGKTIVNV